MKKLFGLLAVAAAFVLGGCGGDGGAAGGTGRVTTYLTDSMDGNDQVWVTVYSIDMRTSADVYHNVFDDPAGRVVDLRSLRDLTGARFAFFGNESASAGSYDGAVVTLARALTVFPAGATNGVSKTFASAFDDPGNGARSRVNFGFSSPRTITAGSNDLVVDFDLASWTDAGGFVTPVLQEGTSTGLSDEGRHELQEFRGIVSNLSGTPPNQSFAVSVRGGFLLNVVTSDLTAIFNSNGAPNPALANGQSVEVRGLFSRTLGALKASGVKIRVGGDTHGEAKVEGPPSNIGVSTFDVGARRVRGFVPRMDVVTVATNGSTRFFSNGGTPMTAQAFYLALATAPEVEAEGTYNSSTNTITALKVKLDDEGGEHEAEVNGQPTNIDAGAGSFRVTLVTWQGFSSTVGASIEIRTTESTTYRNDAGNAISAGTFFAALPTSPFVEVEGHYANGILTAHKAKLDDD